MKIKLYTVKSTGDLKKTPIQVASLNEARLNLLTYYQVVDIDSISQIDVDKQTYCEIEGATICFNELIRLIKDDLTKQKEEHLARVAKQEQEAKQWLDSEVSSKCSEEEQKLFWLLYGNLEATFDKAYWDDEEDSVSLTFKGIPIGRINVKA